MAGFVSGRAGGRPWPGFWPGGRSAMAGFVGTWPAGHGRGFGRAASRPWPEFWPGGRPAKGALTGPLTDDVSLTLPHGPFNYPGRTGDENDAQT